MARCPNQSLPPCSIAAANKAVEDILSRGSVTWRKTPSRGLNSPRNSRTVHVARTSNFSTVEEKARIGRRTAEHDIASTVRYFNKVFSWIFSDHVVKESSVRI